MSAESYAKVLLLSASFAIFTHWAYDFLTRKSKKVKCKGVHEVIMFSNDARELKKSKYSRCVITESMERLLYRLNSARYSLDICMYVLTNSDIANAVLKLHYKGVKVRIIIDADMAYSSGSSAKKLEKQGIPIRWMKSTNLMHHKFCILDASVDGNGVTEVTPLVIAGSLNWTNQALNGNWEDVIVTSQEELVRQFKTEFERLWVIFRPIVDML